MAQLKDTTIQGSARVTDTLYSNAVQAKIFNIPTTSNGTTYGPGTNGYVIKSNGTSVYWGSTGSGSVTSVRVQASSPLQSSVNTAQSTSLDTTISFTNQNANIVLAGPSSGSAAAPAFRALVAADIPSLDWSKIGSGKPTTLSGYGITDAATSGHTQAVDKGGTNITSYAVGDILYASGTTTLSKLTGNTSTTQKFLAMTGTGSAGAAPSWVNAPSGEVFTITISVSHQVYTANKTFAEIQAAFNSGKTVVVNVPDTGGSHYVLCYLSSLSSSSASFVGFDTYTYNSYTAIRRISCAISSSNSVSVSRTHLTSGHEAQPITIAIYEGNPYTATCTGYANIDDIYNVAYFASDGDKGYIRALITTDGTSGTPDGAPEPPTDNQWYNLTNAEKYYDHDANEEIWTLYYTFTFSSVVNVNGTSYLRTIKVTDASNSWDNLSGATVTYSESAVGGGTVSYLPLSGGTMTGAITLANTDTPILSTGNDAGWFMNKYGSITHKRSNTNDYVGIIGYNVTGDIRFYFDSGNITTNGYINGANGVYATNGALVSRAATPQLLFQNASAQDIGGMYASSNRVYIRERPSAGSSYVTDIVFPTAKSNGNENVYVYTSRNFSLSGTTLTITVPS